MKSIRAYLAPHASNTPGLRIGTTQEQLGREGKEPTPKLYGNSYPQRPPEPEVFLPQSPRFSWTVEGDLSLTVLPISKTHFF